MVNNNNCHAISTIHQRNINVPGVIGRETSAVPPGLDRVVGTVQTAGSLEVNVNVMDALDGVGAWLTVMLVSATGGGRGGW